ncbi:TPA: hypothetical protein PPN70_000912 [Serratia rubidaea]|nr:hypothetical protein [Serratia rubidaea]HDJ1447687.1 hypothetical protein [Serratia rubidaea]HDJ1460744.1 hypothetical protein [Serratia rubidaea]HDJ2771080.1 hypothetical protein [Serratia rubidaea]
MSNNTGCKFCRRYGLPILPVRPAVMEKGDGLPALPDSVAIPVMAEGAAAYTTRLMRQGFLYIWAERARRWINYFVTGDGYFYPLPENGEVPPQLTNGEMTPCITQPKELAAASLVTLPVKPAGMINGVFWFAWSEEQWTPTVRQQHEDVAWRSQYMQAFDMDAWLITHRGQQALPFSLLGDIVAEYSPRVHHSTIKTWTPSPLKVISTHSTDDVQQAAKTLHAGNGAILVLSDPLGIAIEISALARHQMQQAITADPELQRGIALEMMLNSVEFSMRNYFYLSAEESDKRVEQQMRYGWDSPAGPHFPAPALADRMYALHEASRLDRVDQAWKTHYEKYIDRTQTQAFHDKLQVWLAEFDQSAIVPLTRMYLAWLQGPQMAGYFIQHFDPTSAHSGARYIQAVFSLLSGMTDKGGVITYIGQQLHQTPLTRENFLQRAAFFNHDKWIAQVAGQIQTSGKDWWLGVSWDRLADAAKEYSGKYAVAILLGLEKLSLLWANAMMKSIDLMVKGTPVRFAIGILAMQGKTFSAVSVTPGTKNYVRAMTIGMARLLEMSGRSGGQLYNAMRKLADKLVKNLPDTGPGSVLLPRVIDVDEAMKLRLLPEKERLAKLNSVLHTDDKLARMLFPRSLSSTLAQAEGLSANQLAKSMATNGLALGSTMFSAYFQWVVLSHGVTEKGLPLSTKERAVFAANASMAIAASAEMLKTVMAPLARMELSPALSMVRDVALKLTRSNFWPGLGYVGGGVYTFIEISAGWSDINSNRFDTGIAHLINGLGIGMMTVGAGSNISWRIFSFIGLSEATLAGSRLVTFFLGPQGIIIGMLLVLGTGAWLLSRTRNDVQNWLLSMQWRQIPPDEADIPMIYPNGRLEQNAYLALTGKGERR